MFEDAVIVQSAINAFNNAALVAPAFLWSAVLTLPLYVLIWLLGKTIANKIGWTDANMLKRASLWTTIIAFGWLVLFGGNYGVLRDDASVLPFMIASIVFVISMFIGSHLNSWEAFNRKNLLYIVLIFVALALSDTHAWWGPILQVGAAFSGFLLGHVAKSEMRDIPGVLLIIIATITAILMQPEFFRFGQLGNLTWLHIIAMMVVGLFAVATIAVRNVKPSGKIHESAYVKLKWMARFVTILGIAVFVMTESVPVFLGTIGSMFILIALSVWHSDKTSEKLGDKLYVMTILLFGIITSMPVICAIGIVCLANMPHSNLWLESKYLL